MIVYRPWGHYKVIYSGPNIRVKILYIEPNKHISLQSHKYRDETWKVLAGSGKFSGTGVFSKDYFILKPRDEIRIFKNEKHTVKCTSKNSSLIILETWEGNRLDETDVTRYTHIDGNFIVNEHYYDEKIN